MTSLTLKNVLYYGVMLILLFGLVYRLWSSTKPTPTPTNPTPTTPTPTNPTPTTPTPTTPTPTIPTTSNINNLSDKTKMNDIQKLVLQNTNFIIKQIKLLVLSRSITDDSIIFKTSPESKVEQQWGNQLNILYKITPPSPMIQIYTEAQARNFKKVIIDDIEFPVIENNAKFKDEYFSYFERLENVFTRIKDSYYALDYFFIKITENGIKNIIDNTIYLTSDESSKDLELAIDFRNMKLNVTVDRYDNQKEILTRFIPTTITSIVFNNKLIMNVEYLPDEKRPRAIPEKSEEERTSSASFSVTRIYVKEGFSGNKFGIF